MKQNSSGKVLTIFLVIIAVLLISLTAISIFFFQKEVEKRKFTEVTLEKSRVDEKKLEEELKTIKKEKFVSEEKNKEADERLNDLSSELDLEKGLREEMKKEIASLKDQLEAEKKAGAQVQEQLSVYQKKINELEETLKQETDLKQTLEKKVEDFKQDSIMSENNITLPEKAVEKKIAAKEEPTAKKENEPVQLGKIEVAPNQLPDGRVLSVDADTEFVIVNLGSKDGVEIGKVMSVYRGKDYLGDIKITRVQPEMSAADFIPPFSSRLVRKNDQVITKQ